MFSSSIFLSAHCHLQPFFTPVSLKLFPLAWPFLKARTMQRTFGNNLRTWQNADKPNIHLDALDYLFFSSFFPPRKWSSSTTDFNFCSMEIRVNAEESHPCVMVFIRRALEESYTSDSPTNPAPRQAVPVSAEHGGAIYKQAALAHTWFNCMFRTS